MVRINLDELQAKKLFIADIFPYYLQAKSEDKTDLFFENAYRLHRDRFPVPRQDKLGKNGRFDREMARKVRERQERVCFSFLLAHHKK